MTSSSGTKFGKTEAGTVWLDAELTSPYRFYQFWYNTTDDDVVKYLKYFTHLTRDEIDGIEADHLASPDRHEAQKRLAREVTAMVHGETACERALRSSAVLFGGEIEGMSSADVREIFDDVPSSEIAPDLLAGDGVAVADLLAESAITPSKGAAKRLIRDGGLYLNNKRVTDEWTRVTRDDFLDGNVLIVRRGQKKYHLLQTAGSTSGGPGEGA